MATETKPAETEATPDEPVVDSGALALSKHLTAWRESYGDVVVDAALDLAAARRSPGGGDKATAGRARASAGQQSSAAPAGRSATDPKSTATA